MQYIPEPLRRVLNNNLKSGQHSAPKCVVEVDRMAYIPGHVEEVVFYDQDFITTVKASIEETEKVVGDTNQTNVKAVFPFKGMTWGDVGKKFAKTSDFGTRGGKHRGTDLSSYGAYRPTKVVAMWAGKVVSQGKHSTMGNYVTISHGNGVLTRYMHFADNTTKVKKGDTVTAGQEIGVQGNTGNSRGKTGIHLHVEVHTGAKSGATSGTTINPLPYLKGEKTINISVPGSGGTSSKPTVTVENTVTKEVKEVEMYEKTVPGELVLNEQFKKNWVHKGIYEIVPPMEGDVKDVDLKNGYLRPTWTFSSGGKDIGGLTINLNMPKDGYFTMTYSSNFFGNSKMEIFIDNADAHYTVVKSPNFKGLGKAMTTSNIKLKKGAHKIDVVLTAQSTGMGPGMAFAIHSLYAKTSDTVTNEQREVSKQVEVTEYDQVDIPVTDTEKLEFIEKEHKINLQVGKFVYQDTLTLENLVNCEVNRNLDQEAAEARITISNPDGFYSPDYNPYYFPDLQAKNKQSPFSYNLGGFHVGVLAENTPVRIYMGYGQLGKPMRVFTGLIDSVSNNSAEGTLDFTARDMYKKIINTTIMERKIYGEAPEPIFSDTLVQGTTARASNGKYVAIDIGHGTDTTGKGVTKNGTFYKEHTFNSAVGVELDRLLQHNGFKTLVHQPPNSKEVGLTSRINHYNSLNLDAVVSIHADYNSSSSAEGRYAFYWHNNTKAKKLADFYAEEMSKKGYSLRNGGTQSSSPGNWTNLAITRENKAVAILTENGFMSNSTDFERIFKSDKYVKDVAEVLARAICRYFGFTFLAIGTSAPAAPTVTTSPAKNTKSVSVSSMSRTQQIYYWAFEKCKSWSLPQDAAYYLLAICWHETVFGTAGQGRAPRNMILGYGSYDKNPDYSYGGIERQMHYGAKRVAEALKSRGFVPKSLDDIRYFWKGGDKGKYQWATDKKWPEKVWKHYKSVTSNKAKYTPPNVAPTESQHTHTTSPTTTKKIVGYEDGEQWVKTAIIQDLLDDAGMYGWRAANDDMAYPDTFIEESYVISLNPANNTVVRALPADQVTGDVRFETVKAESIKTTGGYLNPFLEVGGKTFEPFEYRVAEAIQDLIKDTNYRSYCDRYGTYRLEMIDYDTPVVAEFTDTTNLISLNKTIDHTRTRSHIVVYHDKKDNDADKNRSFGSFIDKELQLELKGELRSMSVLVPWANTSSMKLEVAKKIFFQMKQMSRTLQASIPGNPALDVLDNVRVHDKSSATSATYFIKGIRDSFDVNAGYIQIIDLSWAAVDQIVQARDTVVNVAPPNYIDMRGNEVCEPYGGTVISSGSKNTEIVKKIQQFLMSDGYKLSYGADGSFGPETVTQVKAFQKAKGLTVDGSVGSKTWNAMFCPSGGTNPATAGAKCEPYGGTLIKYGMKNNATVKKIQQYLISKGYKMSSGADSHFGSQTLAAVKQYQKANKLTVDGTVGPKTWNAMFCPSSGGSSNTNNNSVTIPIKTTRSWRSDKSAWRTDTDYLYQGQGEGNGHHRGIIFVDYEAAKKSLKGKKIKSVKLYLHRYKRQGDQSAQKPTFWLHNQTTATGKPLMLTGTGWNSNVGWAINEQKWVTLPNTFGEQLRDGKAKGIGIFAPNGAPYIYFYGASTMKLVIETE